MNKQIRKLQDIDVKDKIVIVRANFDVPIVDLEIADNSRIACAVKTFEHLIQNKCKIVVISHIGDPRGEEVDDLSLMDVRFELGKLLNIPIKFAHIHACENSIKFMEPGEVLLLENIKFHPEEVSEDKKIREAFVKPLSELCDVYVYEAFGVTEELASTTELPKLMKNVVAGYCVQCELENLELLKKQKASPYVSIIGGNDLEHKLDLANYLIANSKVDSILLGGLTGLAFLAAKGIEIGDTVIDKKFIKSAKDLIKLAKENSIDLSFPVDHLVATEVSEDSKAKEIDTQHIPEGFTALDLGPKTLASYREIIEGAKSVLWCGPVGMFELERFNRGSEAIGEYIALSTAKDSYKAAIGESTSQAINTLKIKQKRFTLVSTGGLSAINYLKGEKLPFLKFILEK